MPSKINPNDWDYFFSSTGARRSGPLGALLRTVIVLAVAGGLGYGIFMFNGYLQDQKAQDQTALALRAPTLTAVAFQNSLQQTAQAQPTPTQPLPTSRVLQQTPLRSEPDDAAASQGDVFANSNVQIVKGQEVNGRTWRQVIVVDQSNPASAAPGTQGWLPADVLSDPVEVPVAEVPSAPVAPPVVLNGANLELRRDPSTNISVLSAPNWATQALGNLQLSVFHAPSLDAGEGVVAAKVLEVAQDASGEQTAVQQVTAALAKPGTTPQINVEGANGQTLSGTATWTRTVSGQDYTLKGRFLAQPAPGGSVGVVIAFVPDNSYATNEAVLNQIVQGVIFQ